MNMNMNMNIKDKVLSHYSNIEHPASFTDPQKLWLGLSREEREFNNNKIRKRDVRNALLADESYTTTRRVKKSFRRPKVIAPFKNYMWDVDTAYMSEYKKENLPYIGFVVMIDIHSRYLYTCLIKSVTANEIIKCFKNVFETNNQPIHIRSDMGSEYIAQATHKFLSERNVNIFHTKNSTKSNYAERVILSIKRKLSKYMIYYNTHVWSTALESATKSYNNTFHSGIKMKPSDVTHEHRKKIWEEMYDNPYLYNIIKEPYNKKYKFKVNDVVTISKLRTGFHRGWHENFTHEMFIVVERFKSQGIPHYRLKDYKNRRIEGIFYQEELQKTLIDYNTYNFKIEKIIRKKGNKSLVSWVGWPKEYNSWVLNSQLKSLE